MSSGAYGQQLGDAFRLEHVPSFATRTLKKSELAVTQIRCATPDHGFTNQIPIEDAYLVAYQHEACPDHELWVDGKPVPVEPFPAGCTTFYDLRRDPVAYIRSISHCLMFYLPRSAFDAIADDVGTTRIGDLRHPHGVGADDAVMRNLCLSIMPAFAAPDRASRLFVEHVTLAVGAHVAHTYGGMKVVAPRPAQGGLARWQEKRAKEIISANLGGEISVALLAKECGLSTSHFSRAFRQSTGVAPHRWLLSRRVDAAQAMLRNRKHSLSEIARACGFSDQSHFAHVFSGIVGVSPGVWRRQTVGSDQS